MDILLELILEIISILSLQLMRETVIMIISR